MPIALANQLKRLTGAHQTFPSLLCSPIFGSASLSITTVDIKKDFDVD